MPINKQPIFTATPILECLQFDPVISTSLRNTSEVTIIYTDSSTYGSLITKITVNSPLREPGDSSTTKRIYLMVSNSDDPSKFNLFDSKLMQEDNNYSITADPPSVIFEFSTGLITSPGTILAIGSTTNEATTGRVGDRVTVLVEGGTYDEPA
jgi:hypothetical protein